MSKKAEFVLFPSRAVFLLAFQIALILLTHTRVCALSIKYKLQTEIMTQVGYGIHIQTLLMGVVHHDMSYVFMLSKTSPGPSWACKVELELFTALRSFILPNPMSSKATSTTNSISQKKKCPISSLGSKISREVLPQDILSGSCFCSIYGPLIL